MTACSFSSNNVTPGANPVSSKLTITTMPSSGLYFPARGPRGQWPSGAPWAAFGALGLLGLSFLLWRGNRVRLREGFAIAIIVCLCALQIGCAGITSQNNPGTPTGSYTHITVVAAGGPQQTSTTLTLVVQ
jgi:hypothetical protein